MRKKIDDGLFNFSAHFVYALPHEFDVLAVELCIDDVLVVNVGHRIAPRKGRSLRDRSDVGPRFVIEHTVRAERRKVRHFLFF